MPKRHKTFEQWLTDESSDGHTEFRLVIQQKSEDQGVTIYVHAQGKDSDSRVFEVAGTTIHDVTKWFNDPEAAQS